MAGAIAAGIGSRTGKEPLDKHRKLRRPRVRRRLVGNAEIGDVAGMVNGGTGKPPRHHRLRRGLQPPLRLLSLSPVLHGLAATRNARPAILNEVLAKIEQKKRSCRGVWHDRY